MKVPYQSIIEVNKQDLSALKPRITQYKGTHFRSKSEAVFARCLDLGGALWAYEPFDGKDDPPAGHQWDFLAFVPRERTAIAVCGNHCFSSGLHWEEWSPWFIEYKPKMPTDAYLHDLQARTKEWCDSTSNTSPARFSIVFGSPWQSGEYQAIDLLVDGERPRCCRPWKMSELSSHVFSALSYRFDICSEKAVPVFYDYLHYPE